MQVRATTDAPLQTAADTIVVGAFEGEALPHDVGGALTALLSADEAGGERGRLAVTHVEDRRFIVAGLGERSAFDSERARCAAGLAVARARELRCSALCWEVPHHVDEQVVAGLVEGTMLRDYRFDRYRAGADEDDSSRPLAELIISSHDDVSVIVGRAATLTEAQNRARDLANTPANDLSPEALADYAVERCQGLEGLEVSWLDEEALVAEGMGAFAAVAQGSARSARLIRLTYEGGARTSDPQLALIGKAVTFDSGGISLKPAAHMAEMKFDMSGGAAVIEAIAALAELRTRVRVLGLVGATENMPSGRAVHPGDIVRALDGTTIEVNNTDAEGRLVLADCIALARREGVSRIVDIATLTGGVVIALGNIHAGLMCNEDDFAVYIEQAGRSTGELVWRLPLHERYAKRVRGRYAQLTNQAERREAQAIIGGEFLAHFAGDVPWAHLDIAGTAWDAKNDYIAHDGATGFGVRLLVEIAAAYRASGAPESRPT